MPPTLVTHSELVELIALEFGVDEQDVTDDALLVEDLGADSLDVIELTMHLEERLGIEIPEETAEALTTVGEIWKYLDRRQTAR